MKQSQIPIAVASRSFSRHPQLRSELLAKYDNVLFNDEGLSLDGESLIKFVKGREKLIVGLEKIDESIVSKLPELKVISKYGVGTDMIDKAALISYGVKLGWIPGVNKRSVSELTVAFMISLLRRLPEIHLDLRGGVWKNLVGRQLSEKTVGIIGCGNIGKDLAVILRLFGCHILVNDIQSFPEFYKTHQIEPVSLNELLQRSDIVTLHVPLTERTRGMLGPLELGLMKKGAILINAARGGLVDEKELKRLLINGKLGGAGFDVLATEPPLDFELIKLTNFILTPHIGGSSEEAVLAMGRAAITGLDKNQIPDEDYPPEY